MSIRFTRSATIPAAPIQVYEAWLSSKGHTQMTGSAAKASARVGGAFSAWDGYISGKNLKIKPGKQIVQSWRTTEFTAADPDSQIEILLEKAPRGTKTTSRSGRRAPTVKLPADAKAAWTGRALNISEMPSSSRA